MADPLRRLLAAAARGLVMDAAARLVDRALPRRRGVLTILTYHRVDERSARPDLMPSLLSATPAGFATQMALLARDFDPVSLADVLAALDRPDRLPPRAVLVTFDDGYRDFATHAWPIMQAASVPATLFVATAFSADPTVPFWWDRLWAADPTTMAMRTRLKSLDHDAAMREVDRIVAELGDAHGSPAPAVLAWDDLRRLAAEGVTLAPHTRQHPLLDRVPLERAVAEIAGSLADLEREIGQIAPIPRVLAYPSGAHGGEAVEAARRAGMTLALTTERGGNDLRHADRLRLRRINVGARVDTPLLRAQLVWAAAIDARRPRRP